jgi:excisionase family DNA binding protein
VDEIADHIGVVKASVYRWIERRGLPAHRVGKLWKFKKDEVDDWVRSGGAADVARPRKRRSPTRPRRR